MPATAPPAQRSWRWMRAVVWVLPMVAPLLWLWLLITRPAADAELVWHHDPSHLWLMVVTSGVSLALALKVVSEARRRSDARLCFVGLSFLVAAGFLGLHGLATPHVLADAPNGWFVVSVPIGVTLASIPALASSLELSTAASARVVARVPVLLTSIAALFVVWAAASVLVLPPFDQPIDVAEHRGAFAVVALLGAGGYLVAAALLHRRHRTRPGPVLLSILSAYVLLAEVSIALLIGRSWQASWWTWHIMLLAAFVLVTYAAFVEYGREGSGDELFVSAGLDATVDSIRQEHADALDELVAAIEAGHGASVDRLAADMAARFGLSTRQVQLLARAADALGAERAQQRRLAAIVAIGNESTVVRDEAGFLRSVDEHLAAGFAPDRVEVSTDPDAPPPDGASISEPLVVQGRQIGRVTLIGDAASRGGADGRDAAVVSALATQLGVSLENARLYGQVERLFNQYLSPDVATELLAEPGSAGLGGEMREITVLFADLAGFTSFSERTEPAAVVEMLNTYFAAAVPAVLGEDGTVSNFIGDALMATFGAPLRQRDHALRGVRAALELLAATGEVSASHPDWPVFRVGVNSGPALIGNVGGEDVRSYTAIGDTVNLAARLEAASRPGRLVIGARTAELAGRAVELTALDPLTVKGKAEPVAAFLVEGLTLRADRGRPR